MLVLDRGVRADREVGTIPFLERRDTELPRVFLFPATSLTHRQCGWDRAISLATIVPWCRRWVRPSSMLVFDRGIRVCIFSSCFSPYRQRSSTFRSFLSIFVRSSFLLPFMRYSLVNCVEIRSTGPRVSVQKWPRNARVFLSNDFSVYIQCLFVVYSSIIGHEYLATRNYILVLLNVGCHIMTVLLLVKKRRGIERLNVWKNSNLCIWFCIR